MQPRPTWTEKNRNERWPSNADREWVASRLKGSEAEMDYGFWGFCWEVGGWRLAMRERGQSSEAKGKTIDDPAILTQRGL